MSVRFRIRTSQGQELSFGSADMFAEFVRSGDLSPDDLVYDAETREWAPARVHPLVLEIDYELGEVGAGEVESEETGHPADPSADSELEVVESPTGLEGVDAGDSGPVPDTLGIELAPPVEGLSPEEETAAFLRRMEAERAMEHDAYPPASRGIAGFQMEDSASLGEMISAPKVPPTREPRGRARKGGGAPKPAPSEPRPTPAMRRKTGRTTQRAGGAGRSGGGPDKGGASRKVVLLLLIAGIVAAGSYFGARLMGSERLRDPAEPVDSAVAEATSPEAPAGPASGEEALRQRAQERFLAATQALLGDLEAIPDTWLGGLYFALPSDYEDVRAVWQHYLDVVRDVRTRDRARYRVAYEQALDERGVAGQARDAQLERAVDRFDGRAPARNAHWDRVEALAVAAIQGHNALLGAEGRVLYDASGATGRAAGIGAGTSGRDSDTQLLLDQVIDVITRALSGEGMGPREGRNVRQWVWSGYLDAVTG